MPAIQELICESIDDKFAYAKYGGFKVIMMRDNGYINVSNLCKEGGKEFKQWMSLEYSNAFLDSFSTDLGIPSSNLLIHINGSNTNVLTRGTYAHPDLVPHIASWVSSEFAIKVSNIFKGYFIREERDRLRAECDSLTEMLAEERRLAAEERQKSEVERQKSEVERQKSEVERQKAEERYIELCRQYNITSINFTETKHKLNVVSDLIEIMEDKLDVVSSVVGC